MPFAAARVVGADREQACVFALRTGVGLQRDRVVTGRFAQPLFEVAGHARIALRLVGGREGMQRTEFGPGHGDHLARGVELHRARAQRDHRAVQREVVVGEAAQVAHQLGFGTVAVEHRVLQELRGAAQRLRQRGVGAAQRVEGRQRGAVGGEHRPQRFDIGLRRRFVERQAQARVVDLAQVDAGLARLRVQFRGACAGGDGDRVEERALLHRQAELLQAGGEDRRHRMRAFGDCLQAFGAVVDGEHAGDVGEQHLRGADVRSRLLAADVLFARLHREAVRRLAVAIDRDAHHAARHVALERVLGREVRRVRATEAQRHAEALRAADGEVRAEFGRRREQGQREQVGRDGHQRIRRVEAIDDRLVIVHVAIRRRVLQHGAEERRRLLDREFVAHDDLEAERLGARAHHVDRLRMAVLRHEEGVRTLVLRQALAEGHRFGDGRALVEERGVGDFHAGEVADQRLEVEQRFQAALRDLRLVRRVGRVPRGVLEQVAQDRRGRVRVVVALADERAHHAVAVGDGAQFGERFGFAQAIAGGQHAGALDAGGDDAPVSASSEAWPSTSSIACVSASRGPIWRAMNSLRVSREWTSGAPS
jgi:hypothetical protein